MFKSIKPILKKIALFMFGVIITISCSKELTDLIQTTFPFELTENHTSGDTYVYEKRKVSIEIIPDKVVKGHTYDAFYNVTEGDGYFQDQNGINIPQNQKIIITNEKLKFDWFFVPKKEGKNKIVLSAFNSQNELREIEITFDAKKAPFKVSINFSDSVYLNEKAPVLLNIVREHSDIDAEKVYDFNYTVAEGEGYLYKQDDTKLQEDNEVELSEGETNLYYLPNSIGKHILNLVFKAKDGNSVEKTIEIDVVNIPWDFFIKAPSNTMSVGVPNSIEIVITEDNANNNNYQISYTIKRGVDVTVNNTQNTSLNLITDNFIEYTIDQNENYAIQSAEEGNSTIVFSLKDQNNQIKKDSLLINFNNLSYTFTYSINNDKVLVNSPIAFTLNVEGQNTNDYQIKYDIERGNGELKDVSNTNLDQNNFFPVDTGRTVYTYTPFLEGLNTLYFTCKDSNGVQSTLTIQIEAIENELTFIVQPGSNEMLLGNSNVIGIDLLKENINNTTYEVAYFILGGQGNLKKGTEDILTSTFYSIEEGHTNIEFIPSSQGIFEIIIKLKSNLGRTYERKISIIVSKADWKFEAYSNKNNYSPNEKVQITGSIASAVNEDYNVKFTSNLNGSIEYNGQTYTQGQNLTLTPGNFTLDFITEQEGDYQVNLIASLNNDEKQANLKFNVNSDNDSQNNYQLSATAEKSNIKISDTNTINIELLDGTNNINEPYKLKYTVEGVNGKLTKIDNTNIQAGVYNDTTEGVINWVFVPEEVGKALITITAINANNVEKTANIEVTITDSNWIFSAFTNQSNYTPNDNVIFNVNFSSDIEQDYTLMFTSNLNGSIEYNGQSFTQGETINYDRNNNSLKFLPQEQGNYEVNLIANNGTETQNVKLTFNVSSDNQEIPDFNFSATPTKSEINENETVGINIELTDETNGTNEVYKIKYVLEGVNGAIQNGASTIQPGVFTNIIEGVTPWNFTPSTTGQATITVIVANLQGVEKTQQVKINAVKVVKDFSFTAIKTKTSELVNNPISININLDGPTSEGETYSMYYSINKAGTLEINGNNYSAGQSIDVTPGEFPVNFIGEESGSYTLELFIESNFGITKRKTISLSFNTVRYDLTVTKSKSEIKLGEEAFIDININERGGNSTYTIKYVPIGVSLKLYDNNTQLTAGTSYAIGANNTRWRVIGTEVGEISIDFTVENATGETHTKNVSIDVIQPQWSLSTFAGQSNYKTNEPVNITGNITATTNDDYTVTYTSSLNGSIQYNGQTYIQGQSFSVSKGEFNATFVPAQKGDYQINFVATNTSNNETREASVSFNVDDTIIGNDFNFSATPIKSEINENETVGINIELTDETNGTNETYKIKYVLEGVNGEILNSSNATIRPGLFTNIIEGVTPWNFTPSTTGQATITVIVANPQGVEKTQQFKINVVEVSDEWSFNTFSDQSNYEINQTVNINANITASTTNTYNIIYTSNLNGSIEYNGQTYAQGQSFSVPKGQFNATFVPAQKGDYQINFVATNTSNNETREASVSFNVDDAIVNNEFNFSATPTKSEINENETVGINIELTDETNGTNEVYKIKYVLEGVNGAIQNGASTIQPGVFTNIIEGVTPWNFTPSTTGQATITVIVANLQGVEKTQQVKINAVKVVKDFSFTAIKTKTSELVNNPISININLDGPTSEGETYSMYYSTNRAGSLQINGNSYAAGQSIDVTHGEFPVNFIGEESGSYTLELFIESNFGITKRKTISLSFNTVRYDLTVTKDKSSMTIDDSMFINININESVGNSTYTIKYVPVGVSLELYNESNVRLTPGNDYSIGANNTRWKVVGTEVGEISIDFTVENATGEIESKNITIDVLEKDYKFLATPEKTSEVVQTPINIVVEIEELDTGGETYQLYFESDKDGVVIYNGNEYRPGQKFTVLTGNNTNIQYRGNEIGRHNFILHTEASTLVNKQQNLTLNFNEKNYTLSVNPQKTSIFLDEEIDLNININELLGTSNSYQLQYINKNTINTEIYDENGALVPTGTNITLSSKTLTWKMKGTNEGKVSLEFISTNEDNTTRKALLSIPVNKKDFTLEVNGSSSAFVNNSVNLKVDLSEEVTTGDTFTIYWTSSLSGEMYKNGSQYVPGTNYPIDLGASSFVYKGLEPGTHEIILTVLSSSGVKREVPINIIFNTIDFNFTATPESNSIVQGNSTGINFEIVEIGGTSSYEMKYEFENTTGAGIIKGHNGNTLTPGIYIPLSSKNFRWLYENTEQGNTSISFTIRNTTLNQKNQNVRIQINEKDFDINLNSTQANVYVNNSIEMNSIIDELVGTSSDYSLAFSSNKAGTMKFNGNPLNENTSVTVSGETNYTFTYTGNEKGLHTITYTVSNDQGKIKTSTINLDFDVLGVDFNATARDNTPIILSDIKPIDFVINETGGTQTYKMKYSINSTSGDGDIVDGSNSPLPKNTYFNVTGTSFNFNYKPTSVGRVTILFTIIGQDNEEINANSSVIVNVEEKEYTVTATANANTTFVNKTIPIRYTINEMGQSGFNYTATFNNGGKQGKLIFNNIEYSEGEVINLGTNTTSNLNYKGNEVGSHNITITFKSDWDNTIGKTVGIATLNFDIVDFNFNLISPTPTLNDITLTNHTFNYSINITPTTNESSNYSLTDLKLYSTTNVIVPFFNVTYKGVNYTSDNLPDLPLETGNNELQFLVNNYNKSSLYRLKLTGNISNDFSITKTIQSKNSSSTYINFSEFLDYFDVNNTLQNGGHRKTSGCSKTYCWLYRLMFNKSNMNFKFASNLSDYSIVAYRLDNTTPKTIIKRINLTILLSGQFYNLREVRVQWDKIASAAVDIKNLKAQDDNVYLEIRENSTNKLIYDSKDFLNRPFENGDYL